jgi:hypothetical protein
MAGGQPRVCCAAPEFYFRNYLSLASVFTFSQNSPDLDNRVLALMYIVFGVCCPISMVFRAFLKE